MDPSLQPLLAVAFHQASAREANQAIDDARALAGAEEPFSYEVLVGDETLAQLAARVVPKLVYHLESHGAHLPACHGVFLSLFVGESLCFVHARDAVPLFTQALNESLESLSQKYGTGELRRALRPGEEPPAPRKPLLLPGAKT